MCTEELVNQRACLFFYFIFFFLNKSFALKNLPPSKTHSSGVVIRGGAHLHPDPCATQVLK